MSEVVKLLNSQVFKKWLKKHTGFTIDDKCDPNAYSTYEMTSDEHYRSMKVKKKQTGGAPIKLTRVYHNPYYDYGDVPGTIQSHETPQRAQITRKIREEDKKELDDVIRSIKFTPPASSLDVINTTFTPSASTLDASLLGTIHLFVDQFMNCLSVTEVRAMSETCSYFKDILKQSYAYNKAYSSVNSTTVMRNSIQFLSEKLLDLVIEIAMKHYDLLTTSMQFKYDHRNVQYYCKKKLQYCETIIRLDDDGDLIKITSHIDDKKAMIHNLRCDMNRPYRSKQDFLRLERNNYDRDHVKTFLTKKWEMFSFNRVSIANLPTDNYSNIISLLIQRHRHTLMSNRIKIECDTDTTITFFDKIFEPVTYLLMRKRKPMLTDMELVNTNIRKIQTEFEAKYLPLSLNLIYASIQSQIRKAKEVLPQFEMYRKKLQNAAVTQHTQTTEMIKALKAHEPESKEKQKNMLMQVKSVFMNTAANRKIYDSTFLAVPLTDETYEQLSQHTDAIKFILAVDECLNNKTLLDTFNQETMFPILNNLISDFQTYYDNYTHYVDRQEELRDTLDIIDDKLQDIRDDIGENEEELENDPEIMHLRELQSRIYQELHANDKVLAEENYMLRMVLRNALFSFLLDIDVSYLMSLPKEENAKRESIEKQLSTFTGRNLMTCVTESITESSIYGSIKQNEDFLNLYLYYFKDIFKNNLGKPPINEELDEDIENFLG